MLVALRPVQAEAGGVMGSVSHLGGESYKLADLFVCLELGPEEPRDGAAAPDAGDIVLTGLYRPTEGRVLYGGRDMAEILRHEAVPEMRVDPSAAPCRRSRQTTPSGWGTTASVISVGEKASEEVRCGPRR